VAMCTYNGARYVQQQLQSIAAQECLPDELVIHDDCSSDDTVAIVRRFAAAAPFKVYVQVNECNLGLRENLTRVVAQCRGELIILADQDDLWMPHKVRRLKAVFAADREVGFAFSDALIIDQQQRRPPYRLWQSVGFSRRQQRQMRDGQATAVLLRHNVVCGATLAFRRELRDLLLPIPASWVHDEWFALLSAAVTGCAVIAEPLIRYRRHGGQQIGAHGTGLYQWYLAAVRQRRDRLETIVEGYTAAAQRLSQFRERLRDPQLIAALGKKADHFRAKLQMREKHARRLPTIARELLAGHYARYSLGWKSLAQDLFIA
jgi:glycosyltransferase involved in cell wall biosynthesis